MANRQISAEWAWVSKKPGSSRDYGVLAASGGQTDVRQYVGVYVTGVPSPGVPPGSPGTPPWVTLGSFVASTGKPLVSLLVQDRARGRDQANRPIWPYCLLLFSFDDLAATDASYQTLWHAVQKVHLPPAERAPLPLSLSPQRPDRLAAAIETLGFESLATIAAALLEGRVAVTGAGGRQRDERLRILDAVAALLPYGFRASLTVSTWVENTLSHRIRLVFADFSHDQRLLSLSEAAPLPPGVGRDYLDTLRRKADICGLEAVIAHLWGAKKPLSFERPQDALEILDELDSGRDLMMALREETATRSQVLKFFCRPEAAVKGAWQHRDMSPGMRDNALFHLMDRQDKRTDQILVRHWGVLVDDVARLIRHTLDAGDTEWAIWCLGVVQAIPQAEDDLLAQLLVARPGTDRQLEQRHGALVRLLRRFRPQQDTFPFTCHELCLGGGRRGHPPLVRDVLLGALTSADGSCALEWAHWLCRSEIPEREESPDWVAALTYALTGNADNRSTRSLCALARHGTAWAAVLLRLAWLSGHLRNVLDAADFSPALAEFAVQARSAPEGAVLADALDVPLWTEGVLPNTVAIIDGARLLLGRPPRDFPYDGSPQEIDGYLSGLTHLLALEPVQPLRSVLAERFLRYLLPEQVGIPLADGVVRLLDAWHQDATCGQVLARHIVRTKIAASLLRDDRLLDDFWQPLVQYATELKAFVSVPLLRVAIKRTIENPRVELTRTTIDHHGVPGTVLALAMYDVHRSGMSVPEILGVLIGTSHRGRKLTQINPVWIDDLFRELHHLLFHAPSDGSWPAGGRTASLASSVTFEEFYSCVLAGVLGDDFGKEFARRAFTRIKDEIRVRRKLLRTIRRSQRRRPFARARRSAGRAGTAKMAVGQPGQAPTGGGREGPASVGVNHAGNAQDLLPASQNAVTTSTLSAPANPQPHPGGPRRSFWRRNLIRSTTGLGVRDRGGK